MSADHPITASRSRTALQRSGPPLYRQLADDLRSRILDGEFMPDEPIPTEAQLSAGYHTSRITVRHALDLLAQEGLVHREQGRGSFVRPRAIAVGPRRLTSFTQELRERGVRQGSALLSVGHVPAPADAPLDLGPSASCTRVERVRRADDRPIAHQITWIPAELGAGIGAELAAHGSLYEFLRERHGLEVDSADETYRVGGADTQAAVLLDLAPGAPVFIVERVGFARARRVEWTRSVVRGDDYEVHVHLKR
jgi:GntR family transcriptional regulator